MCLLAARKWNDIFFLISCWPLNKTNLNSGSTYQAKFWIKALGMEMQVVLLFGFGCRNLDAGFLSILSSHFFCLTFHSFSGMFLKLYYKRPYNSFRDHYDSWLKLRKYQYFDGAFKSNNFFMPWTIKSKKCFHVQVFKLLSKWLW